MSNTEPSFTQYTSITPCVFSRIAMPQVELNGLNLKIRDGSLPPVELIQLRDMRSKPLTSITQNSQQNTWRPFAKVAGQGIQNQDLISGQKTIGAV